MNGRGFSTWYTGTKWESVLCGNVHTGLRQGQIPGLLVPVLFPVLEQEPLVNRGHQPDYYGVPAYDHFQCKSQVNLIPYSSITVDLPCSKATYLLTDETLTTIKGYLPSPIYLATRHSSLLCVGFLVKFHLSENMSFWGVKAPIDGNI